MRSSSTRRVAQVRCSRSPTAKGSARESTRASEAVRQVGLESTLTSALTTRPSRKLRVGWWRARAWWHGCYAGWGSGVWTWRTLWKRGRVGRRNGHLCFAIWCTWLICVLSRALRRSCRRVSARTRSCGSTGYQGVPRQKPGPFRQRRRWPRAMLGTQRRSGGMMRGVGRRGGGVQRLGGWCVAGPRG